MKFKMSPNSHIHDKISVGYLMKHFVIALLPIIIYGVVKNGFGAFNVLLQTVLITFIIDVAYFMITSKDSKKDKFSHQFSIAVNKSIRSYSVVSGLILGLILPTYTPFWIIIFGVFGSIIVARHFFGGFGYNLFNPAAVGYLFIMAAYAGPLKEIANNIITSGRVDAVSSSTPLAILNDAKWLISSKDYFTQISFFDLLFGIGKANINQSAAEASPFLILLGFSYLVLKKIINWRISFYYIGTVFIMALIIGLNNKMNLYYPLIQVLTGGLLFGAVFMVSDPVTIPSTPLGHIVAGILLGVFTMLIRIAGPSVEGVMTSILAINILTPLINDLTLGRSKRNMWSTKPVLAMTLLICFVLSTSIWLSSRVTNLNRPTVEVRHENI